MSVRELFASAGATEDKQFVEDVFSAYTYTGNGGTQNIINGIDLAGKGGLVWAKCRNASWGNLLYDTARGRTKYLQTDNPSGQGDFGVDNRITSFNSNGYSLGDGTYLNTTSETYASWTFREAPKFFTQKLKVHTNGTASTVDLSSLGTVGMVTVKSTLANGNWFTWHKDLTAGNNLKLNLTDTPSATNAYLSVSGTTLTISGSAPSDTYIVYAFAHDPSADGIIQCGSYTTISGAATVTLGFEPQYLMWKRTNSVGNWYINDASRVFSDTAYNLLEANTTYPEIAGEGEYFVPTATGFRIKGQDPTAGATYAFIAIRRPNKPPTLGTQVYNAIARTGTGAVATVSGVGFAPDLAHAFPRTLGSQGMMVWDRLRGAKQRLDTFTTTAETTYSTSVTSFNMDGVSMDNGYPNTATTYINHFFKRAKGFMDNFCYTGTGANRTINHNLGAVPDLLIFKSRSGATAWQVWFNGLTSSEKLVLNSTAAKAADTTLLNSTLPTSTLISLGTQAAVNTSSATYVGYAFANLPGIQSIGTYTGNGSTQTINCGFTTGARFVLSKAVSTTGNWNLGDSTRGIVAGADGLLCLNTTAAEVTTDDWLDNDASGFIVNETSSAHANTNGVQYVFLAIA